VRIINIETPGAIYEVGSYEAPSGVACDVELAGDLLYVAYLSAGLRIVNVSNPMNPYEESFYDTPGSAYSVQVAGNYAYVADWNKGLRVINVQNPVNPYEVGYYDTPRYAYGVAVSGSHAYVADDYYFEILDCSQALPVLNFPAPHLSSFILHPFYPNPFNPETKLVFELPEASAVSLALFDLSGRKVAEILNEWKSAGTFEVTIDASRLVSGVYFAHFKAGNFAQTQKLVLTK
jgi:hypothetical protein